VEHEENIQRLRDNAQALGAEREKGPPREGPALLQGLVVCAQCGERMTVRYHQRGGRLVPEYMCQARSIQRGRRVCQQIPGAALDDAIGKLLIDTVTPLTLEVAFAVQTELENRCDEAERLRLQEVERARYQSDLARLRFMHVDPSKRLVADSLEAEWNQALRALTEAKERFEKLRQTIARGLTTSSVQLS
jgi:Recombinase zinc beta ribbon domain